MKTRGQPIARPMKSLTLILLLTVWGSIAGRYLATLLYLPFFSGTEQDLLGAISDVRNHPDLKMALYGILAGATIGGTLISPVIYLRMCKRSISNLFGKRRLEIIPILILSLIVVAFMVVNSIFIEWNTNLEFPSFLKGFEDWSRQQENAASELTDMLTQFHFTSEFFSALIVLAVLPAIGEEMVFRGLIQNELYRSTRNIHLSIWVAAALFSAFHMQFFGFVPRLFLGALIGYLYYWSANLSFAIIAHFINNGLILLTIYLYQLGVLETPKSAPTALVCVSVIVTVGLSLYFFKYFRKRGLSIT